MHDLESHWTKRSALALKVAGKLTPSATPPSSCPSTARSAVPVDVPTSKAVEPLTLPTSVSAGGGPCEEKRGLDKTWAHLAESGAGWQRRTCAVDGEGGALPTQVFDERRRPLELARLGRRDAGDGDTKGRVAARGKELVPDRDHRDGRSQVPGQQDPAGLGPGCRRHEHQLPANPIAHVAQSDHAGR